MTKTKTESKQAGFSLLELLLVVGVGALLLLAGIATYRLVTQGTSANEAIRVLTTLKEKTQRAFQGQRGYTNGSLVDTLVTMNAFPAGVLDDQDNPIHAWGGDITIVGAGRNFDIAYVDVPPDACVSLGTSFDEEDTDFVSLNVGGTTYDDASGDEINAVNLAESCDSNDGQPVTMTWRFF